MPVNLRRASKVRRLLPLAALALLVPAATALPAVRAPIVIANYADDGSPGTLRHAIESVARPGDTIQFAAAVRLELGTPLVVPRELSGLTIDGATPSGGKVTLFGARFRTASASLEIDADSVTLRNLTLTNLPVAFRSHVVSGNEVGPSGASVIDNELIFEASYPRRSRLDLSFTRGARVEGNKFLRGDGGISLSGTRSTTIAGNTFELETGGLSDDHSRALQVERNTLTSGLFLFESVGATVARNVVGAKGRIAAADVAGNGFVRVVDNTFEVGGLRTGLSVVTAHHVEVLGNTATGRSGRSNGIYVGCREQSPGRAIVERNRVEGLRRGLTIACSKDEGTFTVGDNIVRRNSDAGIVVRANDVTLTGNTVEGNGTGIRVERTASIVGGTVRGNRRAGILVEPNAGAKITGLGAGANGGPGIDLAPAGVTPNATHKSANDDIPFPEAKYDGKTGRLRGSACPGCRIQVYESEDGSKRGNPKNGEGTKVIGGAQADADGRWVFPAARVLDCPRSGRVTMTATRGGVTSEFSVDVECGCLLSKNFIVSGAGTPRTGFRSFGLRVTIPKGSKVERATLVDVRTEERPRADALGEMIVWEEVQRDSASSPPGFLTREYLVNVSYRPNETGFSLSRQLWRFSISYEPPRNTTACAARATEMRP
jgi:parallel beta-helix repeat protein